MEKINVTPDPFCAWLAMCLEDRKLFLLQRTEMFQTQGTSRRGGQDVIIGRNMVDLVTIENTGLNKDVK